MKVIIVIVVLALGYVLLSQFGGESVTTPEVNTDLPVPDSPKDGANEAADWLETRPEWFWQLVAGGIVLALIYVASIKMPKLFYVGIGLVVMGFIAFAVMK